MKIRESQVSLEERSLIQVLLSTFWTLWKLLFYLHQEQYTERNRCLWSTVGSMSKKLWPFPNLFHGYWCSPVEVEGIAVHQFAPSKDPGTRRGCPLPPLCLKMVGRWGFTWPKPWEWTRGIKEAGRNHQSVRELWSNLLGRHLKPHLKLQDNLGVYI